MTPGARQNNVLSKRWDEIDFDLGTWRIPKTKNGESQTIPLTRFVLQLLHDRHEEKDGDWVFPGEKLAHISWNQKRPGGKW